MSGFAAIRAKRLEREREYKLARENKTGGSAPWSTELKTLLEELKTNSETGLSNSEAKMRQEADGPNALQDPEKVSRLKKFLGQFKSPVDRKSVV